MKNIYKLHLIVNILLTLLFSLGFYLSFKQFEETGQFKFINSPEEDTLKRKLVYITGEVNNPGVYEFTEELRVAELIQKTGGFTENADPNYINKEINLAAIIEDEESFYIPNKINIENGTVESSTITNTSSLIDINSATQVELETLIGIGPSLSYRIIDNRPYETIEDILNVPGIGESKFNSIKNDITVN